MVYRLHAQKLIQQLTHFSDGKESCALVTDLSGHILAASPDNEELVFQLEKEFPSNLSSLQELTALDETYMLSAQTVPTFGVQLVILMPKRAIVAQATSSIREMLAILLWVLCLSLIHICIAAPGELREVGVGIIIFIRYGALIQVRHMVGGGTTKKGFFGTIIGHGIHVPGGVLQCVSVGDKLTGGRCAIDGRGIYPFPVYAFVAIIDKDHSVVAEPVIQPLNGNFWVFTGRGNGAF